MKHGFKLVVCRICRVCRVYRPPVGSGKAHSRTNRCGATCRTFWLQLWASPEPLGGRFWPISDSGHPSTRLTRLQCPRARLGWPSPLGVPGCTRMYPAVLGYGNGDPEAVESRRVSDQPCATQWQTRPRLHPPPFLLVYLADFRTKERVLAGARGGRVAPGQCVGGTMHQPRRPTLSLFRGSCCFLFFDGPGT